jgi:hypothetical protein
VSRIIFTGNYCASATPLPNERRGAGVRGRPQDRGAAGSAAESDSSPDRRTMPTRPLGRGGRNVPASPDENTTLTERSLAFVRDDTAPPDLTSIRAMIESEVDQLSKQNELLLQAWNKELSSEHGYNDWRYITATAITRVCVVLIIVYLVQIMMRLYRYNTRLIAYYNSRRDLLALWDGSIKSLKPLDEIMALE